MAGMSHAMTDMARKLANLIGLGTIAEVDPSFARVKADINGRLTGWLPHPADIGNNYRAWRPLRVGTQVIVACPAGDPANAVIIGILYSAALPPPADTADIDVVAFNDGTTLRYDSGAKVLTVISAGDVQVQAAGDLSADIGGAASVTAAGPLTIKAPTIAMTGTTGGATASLVGNFSLTGNLDVTGSISATGSIMDGGGNSNHHTH